MRPVNDPLDLYRQVRIAQRQAERGGFTGTAAALAVVAEMIVLEAGVSALPAEQVAPGTASPAMGALPIYRMAWC